MRRHILSQIKTYGVPSAPAAKVTVFHDDLLHPVLGGNKLRKLDALIPTLLATGVTDVVILPYIHHKHMLFSFPRTCTSLNDDKGAC